MTELTTSRTQTATSPRKLPKQQRAIQTVEKILQATESQIIAEGIESLSTNKIADEAGINIASLYQYFPNKESILTALGEKHIEHVLAMMNEQMDSMEEQPIEQVLREWLQTGVRIYRQSDGIFPHYVRSYLSTSPFPGIQQIEARLMAAGKSYLEQQSDADIDDINAAVYVGFSSAMLVLCKHLVTPSGYLTDEDIIDNVVSMLSRFFSE